MASPIPQVDVRMRGERRAGRRAISPAQASLDTYALALYVRAGEPHTITKELIIICNTKPKDATKVHERPDTTKSGLLRGVG